MRFFKRFMLFLLIPATVGAAVYIARRPLLRGIGHHLIKENTPRPVDAIFVLSGDPSERCPKATELYHEGMAPIIVATGEGINPTLSAMDINLTDAEVGQQALWEMGVDSSSVLTLKRGSSTFEESEEILGYSTVEGYNSVMIVSSKFHTRRIQSVFRQKFKAEGIDVVVVGAQPDPDQYQIDTWWEYEAGLIFVNNEYLKSLYYWMKY